MHQAFNQKLPRSFDDVLRAANVDVLEGLGAGFADDADQVYHGIDAPQATLDRVCLEDVSWMNLEVILAGDLL
jgi:hypothetical protein